MDPDKFLACCPTHEPETKLVNWIGGAFKRLDLRNQDIIIINDAEIVPACHRKALRGHNAERSVICAYNTITRWSLERHLAACRADAQSAEWLSMNITFWL
jgi:hypothetical protein